MVKAALIDLDGFLVNTDDLFLEANKQYFRQLGFEFTSELYRESMKQSFVKWITSVVDVGKPGETILQERNTIFYELAREKLALQPGATTFLQIARSHFATALVTSARTRQVNFTLHHLSLEPYFDHIVTREMVERGKPDPACYLLAMQRLGMQAEECVAFEDGPTGILAAKAAGLRVVAVRNPFIANDAAYNQADIVLEDISQVAEHLAKQVL